MKKKVIVAMSGGVDSSTTAALLKEQGYDVSGITMQLWDYAEEESGCCSLNDVLDARQAANQIGIDHTVVDYKEDFQKYVVKDFIEKYYHGQTPNPCIMCNEYMKFNFLLNKSLEMGADFLATGHYAKISQNKEGTFFLEKGLDKFKDQSYFLFTLSQKELSRLMFPLGSFTKPEVRKISEGFELSVSTKKESQDVCFIAKDYRTFIEKNVPDSKPKKGLIKDLSGEVLGSHLGIHNFTIGQRKKLKINSKNSSSVPLYVIDIDFKKNEVLVGTQKDLYASALYANNLNWSIDPKTINKKKIMVKIRYRSPESLAEVNFVNDRVSVVFDEPQRSITPGQAIVFYQDDKVLGGGWIDEVSRNN
ncbi:tRNA 2-thiouridine(34) synthase MnmA [bacterium]|jgi:tRNA-uridine 2-sulfurtransferase|nr:tRNA 2-thiouridine(34) synthase MnmA [bacterium]MBT3849753.1 tRNA 2-thiouridine(34) synthase MnmA [bacterium]